MTIDECQVGMRVRYIYKTSTVLAKVGKRAVGTIVGVTGGENDPLAYVKFPNLERPIKLYPRYLVEVK